jgi:hypothetical protein
MGCTKSGIASRNFPFRRAQVVFGSYRWPGRWNAFGAATPEVQYLSLSERRAIRFICMYGLRLLVLLESLATRAAAMPTEH